MGILRQLRRLRTGPGLAQLCVRPRQASKLRFASNIASTLGTTRSFGSAAGFKIES
jgi:hypothetical protein